MKKRILLGFLILWLAGVGLAKWYYIPIWEPDSGATDSLPPNGFIGPEAMDWKTKTYEEIQEMADRNHMLDSMAMENRFKVKMEYANEVWRERETKNIRQEVIAEQSGWLMFKSWGALIFLVASLVLGISGIISMFTRDKYKVLYKAAREAIEHGLAEKGVSKAKMSIDEQIRLRDERIERDKATQNAIWKKNNIQPSSATTPVFSAQPASLPAAPVAPLVVPMSPEDENLVKLLNEMRNS